MMEPKLTVIMSNYNQADLISQAIESVLAQKTNFPFQLIIADDHSTKDNSVEIIKTYEGKYPDKIKAIYNQENGRYLKNILRAKAITKTPYFTLLDADDYWTDEYHLQKAVNFLEKNLDYTIYAANVLALHEDGRTHPYVSLKEKTASFSLKDFLNGSIIFSQTTGMVFRNVIYIDGIPDIVQQAVGTISERSFEGDIDRYVMHLKYGKSYFVNEICGVYRILATGIWQSLNPFEQAAIQAQAFIDYDRFFEEKYHDIFINKAWFEIKKCILYLDGIVTYEIADFRNEAKEKFFSGLSVCMKNKEFLISDTKIKKWKYRVLKKIYVFIRKKLLKKGLI